VEDYINTIKSFFKNKSKDNDGFHIIGLCDDITKNTIGATTNQVVISNITIEKNIKHHTDLTIEDYNVINNIFENYSLLLKDTKHTVGVIYTKKQQYYYALKSTKSGDTIFLTSFRKTNKSDIKRIRNKSKKGLLDIIIDNID
jgi:hypothetical protein